MKKVHLSFLVSLLTILGLGIFLYKALILEYPLSPDVRSSIWNIETYLQFTPGQGPVKISMFIPNTAGRFRIDDENFISRGYGIHAESDGVNKKVVWTIRKATGEQSLYYRATVRRLQFESFSKRATPPPLELPIFDEATLNAAESVVASVREKSADTDSFVKELLHLLNNPGTNEDIKLLLGKDESVLPRLELTVRLLAMAGIPARVLHCVRLAHYVRNAPLIHWLEIFDENQWYFYNPVTGQKNIPNDYLVWWKGSEPLIKSSNTNDIKARLSVVLNQEKALRAVVLKSRSKQPFLFDFSLFSLPVQTQAVYRILLMVPVAVFLLVIFRNIIGIQTFGTFMPVLIALAFRETRLLSGIVLFVLLVAVGASIRLYLERLKLLVVPRLASVLIVVILLMMIVSIVTQKLGIERGISVALFPMVILTMTIERLSIIWEELGALAAVTQVLGSLVTATFAYLVMNIKLVEHLVFVFPELLLVLLACTLLLGRYSGYRLFELIRFKALMKG